ncbi:MAG: alpha/beta hydrolase [Acidobacteriota bacterium]
MPLVILLLTGCASVSKDAMNVPRFVDGPGGKLWIDDGGRGGVPVIFVHGNGASSSQWSAQLAHLRMHRRSIAFDLRGMGHSDPAANGDYSVSAVSGDIGAVADALGIRRFVLVGHSYGGAIVGAYAAAHPDRIAGLVFVDSAGDLRGTAEAGAAKFDAALRSAKGDAVIEAWFAPLLEPSTEAVQQQVLASAKATDREVFIAALQSLRSYDPILLRDRYRGPELIVARQAETSGSLQSIYGDVPVKLVSGSGHWIMLDQPEELNAILDGFLAGIRE